MLTTRPRMPVRSTCSSCTTPASSTATRVSCGVMLISMSSIGRGKCTHRRCGGNATATRDGRRAPAAPLQQLDAGLRQQAARFEQGQSHDPGVTAFDALDEEGGEALDAVAAGLVVRFRGGAIALDL